MSRSFSGREENLPPTGGDSDHKSHRGRDAVAAGGGEPCGVLPGEPRVPSVGVQGQGHGCGESRVCARRGEPPALRGARPSTQSPSTAPTASPRGRSGHRVLAGSSWVGRRSPGMASSYRKCHVGRRMRRGGKAEPTGAEATPEAGGGAPSGLSTLRGQEPQSRGRGDPRQDSCAPLGLDTEVGTPGKQAPCSALLGH